MNEKKELRKFGITIGIALILLSGIFFLLKRNLYFYFLYIGVLVFLFGVGAPGSLKYVLKGWMVIGEIAGSVITRIILALLFYIVLTPMGTLARLSGERFSHFTFRLPRKSYWHEREQKSFEAKDWEKQF